MNHIVEYYVREKESGKLLSSGTIDVDEKDICELAKSKVVASCRIGRDDWEAVDFSIEKTII